MAGDLTTVYLVKTLTGLDAENSVLERYVSAVCREVKQLCGREFNLRDIYQWTRAIDGHVYLLEWPLDRLVLCSIGTAAAFRIQRASGPAYASVQVKSDALVLVSVASGVTTASEVDFSSHASVGDVADGAAGVNGWTVSNRDADLEGLPAQYLKPRTEDALYPAYACPVVADPGERCSAEDVPSAEYMLRLGMAADRVFLHYRAGYTLPEDTPDHSGLATSGDVPADLVMAVSTAVKDAYEDARNRGLLESEKIGDYSYRVGDVARRAVDRQRAQLFPYRRMAPC